MKLHMYDVFYNTLQPSLKDLQLHHIDTDTFVLSFSERNVDNEHRELSKLEPPMKTNNKVPRKVKNELGCRIIEEFIALSKKTSSFKDYQNKTKEKGLKNCNNAKQAKHKYYSASLYNTQRTVDECRKQKVGDDMTTTKTSMISLNTFDDKDFM